MSLNKTQALNTAKQYLLQKKLQAAIDIYKGIIEADPSDLNAVNTLGDLYAGTGRVQDAMTLFRRVADGYLEADSLRKGIAMLKKILALDPENSETAIELADTYARAGLPIEARQEYLQIADGYTFKGKTLDALRVYCKIVELDPSNASTQIKLGELYLREGMSEQAYEAFLTAARQLATKGEIRRALTAYNEALAVRPASVEALAALHKLTGLLGAAHADKGLPGVVSTNAAFADPANENAPSPVAPDPVRAFDSPDHLSTEPSVSAFVVQEISKAEILVAYGKVSQAITMLVEVLKTEPDNVHVHIKLKDIYLRTGMMADAAQECLKLARIHERHGERDRARDYAARANRLGKLIEQASVDLQESTAKPGDKAEIHTVSSPPTVASSYESLATVPHLASKLDATQPERNQLVDRVIPTKARDSEVSATPAESVRPVAPLTLVREQPLSPPPTRVELVTKPLRELAIERASDPEPEASARPLPALFEFSAPREKKRGRFYTALASITLMVLGTGALIGRSAYEARLDTQYQELTLTTPPLDFPSPPPTPASEDSEAAQQGESLTVVVTPSPQPEATLRIQKPEPAITNNERPVSPQPFSPARKPTTPPSPTPPRIVVNSDTRVGTENATPAGVPTAVPTGVPAPAPAPVEPPPKVMPKAPVLMRGGVVKRVQPAYPLEARNAQVSGVVTVELSINEQGDVTSARATSGPALLRNAAVSAARGWKFKPSTVGGVPVKTTTVIAFNFNL